MGDTDTPKTGPDQDTEDPDESQVETPVAPQAAAEHDEKAGAVVAQSQAERGVIKKDLLTRSDINAVFINFVTDVKKGPHDFSGKDEPSPETEPVFIEIKAGLEAIFKEDMAKAPKKFVIEWMKAACNFMASEISYWDGRAGSMTFNDAHDALKALRDGTPGKAGKGPGMFKNWIKESTLSDEYDKYLADKASAATAKEQQDKSAAAAKEQQKAADKLKPKKDELTAKIAKLETDSGPIITGLERIKAAMQAVKDHVRDAKTQAELDELSKQGGEITRLEDETKLIRPIYDKAVALEARLTPPKMQDVMVPAELLAKVRGLKAEVGANKQSLQELDQESKNPELEKEIAAVEALKAYDNDEIPPETRASIFKEVHDGKKTPEQAKVALEQAKKTADAVADKEDEEDTPFLDRAKAFVDRMAEGPWKKTLGGLVATLGTVILALVKLPWIGDKLRGGAVSNELLAKAGDQRAVLALKVEGEFKKFGLPRKIANALGGMKTADVVKEIKEKPVKDAKLQAKLAWLGKQLENKGGATSEKSIFEFMDPDGDWKDIQYKESATAVAVAVAAPAAPAVAPAVAPATGQTAPTGAPAAPTSQPPPPPATSQPQAQS